MSDDSTNNDFIDHTSEQIYDIEDIASETAKRITVNMNKVLNYKPKVGILGKTGVGKSSLCNAIFEEKVAEVNDIEACTREPEKFTMLLGKGSKMVLLDMPGVGESKERDAEYGKLYRRLVPQLDLIIWVLKADDRAYSTEEVFFEDVVNSIFGRSPFLIALNQIEKIEPLHDWDSEMNRPGPGQRENIESKISVVSDTFNAPHKDIIPVSASQEYGLEDLLLQAVRRLPDEQKFSFEYRVNDKYRSEETKREARKGRDNAFKEEFRGVWEEHGDKVLKILAAAAVGGVFNWVGQQRDDDNS